MRPTAIATPRVPHRAAPVPLLLRLGLHMLVIVLLLPVAVAGPAAERHPVVLPALTLVVAAGYLAGPLLPAWTATPRGAAIWLGLVLAGWTGLVLLSPQATWVAFPLFFVILHQLDTTRGLLLVAVTTAVSITGYGWHSHELVPGIVVGPLLGAAVAVATVLGYEALHRESEAHRRLVTELVATRDELAQAERTAGRLAERERVAREIHDTLAQGLSSIQLLLRAAERALPADVGPARDHVDHARRTAVANLEEARRFVRGWSPAGLAEASLPEAVAALCDGGAGGVPARFRQSGEPRAIGSDREAAVLRVAQAALRNAGQHAGATAVTVTLSYMDDAVALDVIDDGVGFAPDALAPPGDTRDGSGYGVPAMRARAAGIGAELSIESGPGQGTAVALNVPLPATLDPVPRS